MEPRRIGLYLTEESTAEQLMDYWEKKAPQYRFIRFASKETLSAGLQEEPLFVLITDGACFMDWKAAESDTAWADRVGRVVFLVEDESAECVVGGIRFPCVFRYQSADQILAGAVGMREEGPAAGGRTEKGFFEEAWSEEGGAQVIGVYSPIGRCGKSRFALALGKIYAEQKRTLYLSLEIFSDLYEWLVDSGAGDFSDLLYYQEQGKLTDEMWKQLTCERQGLALTGPAVNPDDVVGLSAQRCREILRSAAEAGYEVIILDLGNQHPDPAAILALCGQIYAPVTGEEVSRLKWQHFMAYLRKSGREQLRDRMDTVRLPEGGSGYLAGGFPNSGEALEAFARRLICCRN